LAEVGETGEVGGAEGEAELACGLELVGEGEPAGFVGLVGGDIFLAEIGLCLGDGGQGGEEKFFSEAEAGERDEKGDGGEDEEADE